MYFRAWLEIVIIIFDNSLTIPESIDNLVELPFLSLSLSSLLLFSLYYLDNDEVSEALDLGGEGEAEEEGEEAGAEHAHGEEVAEVLHQSELSTRSRDLHSTSAANRSIGSTTGCTITEKGEGPY